VIMKSGNVYILCIIAGMLDVIIYMEYQSRQCVKQQKYNYIRYAGIAAAIITDIACCYDFLCHNRCYMYIVLALVMVVMYMKSMDIYEIMSTVSYHISVSVATAIIVRFFLETYSFTRIEKHVSDMNSEMIIIIMTRILFMIVINIYDKYVGISLGRLAGIAVMFTSISAVGLIIMLSRLGYAYSEARKSITILIILIMAVFNIIDVFINTIEQNNRYNYELMLLERERETNIKIYDNIRSGQEELRNIRHDIKNRLNSLRTVILQNDNTSAIEYLDNMIGSVDSVKGNIYCNNLLINNILAYKLDNLDDNIELECQADVPEQLDVDMGDMGVIIGNLLDNSIKAVGDIVRGGYIHIVMTESIGRLIIIIENNYIDSKEKKPASYYINHGRGVNNVRRIVKKYGGTYNEKVSADVYQTKVTLDI
jgi:signal transduction histidine kinase